MWPSLVKIQYTELKLSCGNDPVVKNYIYSNGDLNLWPNDPKINLVLPLPQGNHVAKFGKDPIYRTKVIMRKPVWTPAARHTQSHNTAPSRDGCIQMLDQSFSFSVINRIWNTLQYGKFKPLEYCRKPSIFSNQFQHVRSFLPNVILNYELISNCTYNYTEILETT
jgi:hypothetical protein